MQSSQQASVPPVRTAMHPEAARGCSSILGPALQGQRSAGLAHHMEDEHCAWLALPGLPSGWAFFAVLDCHGGAQAALFGARHLPGHVLEA